MSRRVVAVAVAVSLALLAGWFIAIKSPQSKAGKRARAEQSAALQQVTSLKAQTVTLLQQQAGLPAVQAQLEALKVALPAKAALDQVIDAIQQASTASGVNLGTLSQSAATTSPSTAASVGSGLQLVNLTLSATGTYNQLMDYVNQLNRLARTMVVDNLTMGVSATTGTMSAQITGRMFFVPTGS